MLMIISIEFDIRHPFSDVKAEILVSLMIKRTKKSIASQNIKPLLLLARRKSLLV